MKSQTQFLTSLFISVLLLGVCQAGITNRCAPLFLGDDNVAFDFNQVNPTDPNNPLVVGTAGLTSRFLLCQGIPDSVTLDAKCTNKLPDNLAYVVIGNDCYPTTTSATTLTTTFNKDGDGKPTQVVQTYDNSPVQGTAKSQLYTKNLKIVLNCNKDSANGQAAWTVDNSDPNYLTYTTTTAAACGTSLHDVFAFFIKYKWLFGGILILLSILFTFFGKRFFIITLVIVGFLIGFLAIVGTAYLFSAMQNA